MTLIHHPDLDVTVDVPPAAVRHHLVVGWQRVERQPQPTPAPARPATPEEL